MQIKELEDENEEMRLRNLRRVKTEEKLCDEKSQENNGGSADEVDHYYVFALNTLCIFLMYVTFLILSVKLI